MHREIACSTKHPSLASICLAISLLATLLIVGCGAHQRTEPPKPVSVTGIDTKTAMAASEHVLRKMSFVIEKSDPEAGVIRTRPLTGSQFFEFWRKDSVGSFNGAESNVNSLRRVAEIAVEPADDGLTINCYTSVQRLNVPEHPVTSSSRAYAMYSKSTGAMQRLLLTPDQEEKVVWTDLGPDHALADAILQRIQSRIAAGQKEQSQ